MSDAPAQGNKRSPWLLALLAIIALLLVAIIVLLVVNLLPKGAPAAEVPPPPATNQPTPSLTPITPTVTPIATPTPSKTTKPANNGGGGSSQPSGPGFTAFNYSGQVTCKTTDGGGPYYSPTITPIPIKVSWKTVHATEVWFVMGHSSDAANDKFVSGPANGSQSNFKESGSPVEIDYPCGVASQEFTMTLVGDNGQHITKHWTVKNNGAQY